LQQIFRRGSPRGRSCGAGCGPAPRSVHVAESTIRAPRGQNVLGVLPRARMRRIGFLTLLWTSVGAIAAGCGRRATDADCRLIVDRSVELQMKEMSYNDAAAIAEREQQVRAELDDQIRSCEARRVTDKTVACVRAAATIKELDSCLR
jgi:hypothetical protein